jgi:hypothetical protein
MLGAVAGTDMAKSDVQTAILLTHALAAAKRGEPVEAKARLGAAETRMQTGTPPRWLAQEREQVTAMVAAQVRSR